MIVAWCSLVMGLSAIGISIYYSIQWFLTQGMPTPVAWIIAITYVLFTNFVFEFAIERLKKYISWNNKRKVLSKGTHAHKVATIHARQYLTTGTLQIIGWAALAVYSMNCTVGGQYEQLVNKDTTEQVERVQDYTKTIELKEGQVLSLQTEITELNERTASVDSVQERYQYKNTTGESESRLDEKSAKLDTIIAELEDLYTKQNVKDFADVQGVSRNNYFVYLSDVVGQRKTPLQIQFISAVFPSVVIDILSPICLTIFMLTWAKRKR